MKKTPDEPPLAGRIEYEPPPFVDGRRPPSPRVVDYGFHLIPVGAAMRYNRAWGTVRNKMYEYMKQNPTQVFKIRAIGNNACRVWRFPDRKV